jgi:GWxTD domain-containing protein
VSNRWRSLVLAALPAWALVALGIAFLPSTSGALDLSPLRSESAPSFTADVAVSLDNQGATLLALSVIVPYAELQWIRIPQGYGAGLEVTVVFKPPGHGAEYGDSWQKTATSERFDPTLSQDKSIVERRNFKIPPGRYDLRVRVHDLNSGRESSASERVDVPDYSRVPLAIAGMELGRVEPDGAFTPLTTRRFGLDSDRLAAAMTLVDRRSGSWPRTYHFAYRIADESGDDVRTGDDDITATRLGEPVILRPDSGSLFVGTYSLEVTLQDGKGRWKLDRSFEVEESGPPRGREFKQMLEPLSYIATSEEIDKLNKLDETGQAAGWEAFWAKRDPTPDTPRNEALLEFLRRVRYANHHFQHFGPGWRSDMGRIYIKYGPPDHIESHTASTQSPQLETWYYNQPYRQFVFEDRDGFGRYVLVSPE